LLIIRMVFLKPCRTENGNTWPGKMQVPEPFNKFRNYTKGKGKFLPTALGAV